MNILSYVHLRNIYRSTGVGRVARELTEHLAVQPENRVEILADRGDYDKVIEKVGEPWTSYNYHFFRHDTSRQQAIWFLADRPSAEEFWPATDVVYCTAESYVPVRKARLAVSCHDAQHFEPGVHKVTPWLLKQRAKWKLLFDRLAEEGGSVSHDFALFGRRERRTSFRRSPRGSVWCRMRLRRASSVRRRWLDRRCWTGWGFGTGRLCWFRAGCTTGRMRT